MAMLLLGAVGCGQAETPSTTGEEAAASLQYCSRTFIVDNGDDSAQQACADRCREEGDPLPKLSRSHDPYLLICTCCKP
jgi:hypothetical protein